MKHSFFLPTILFSIIITACKSDETIISETALGYLESVSNYRIDDAAPYATKKTKETTLKFIKDVVIPMTDTNYLKSAVPATVTIDSIKIIKSDTAIAYFTKVSPLNTVHNSVTLIKEEDNWLVNVLIE